MKKTKKMDLAKFETLGHSSDGKLVGGFSVTFTASTMDVLAKNDRCQTVNNCNGGNCVSGCGKE